VTTAALVDSGGDSRSMPDPAPDPSYRPPDHNRTAPHRFFWIALPYAIYIGFVTNGGVSYLLRRAGMPATHVANAVALLGIPSALYFLWSPLADLALPRRWWHLLATVCTALALTSGSLLLPHHSEAAVWLYFAGLIFCMLISSAYGGLIASMIAPPSRNRTSAWTQASNLGGGALGPGLILFLALHTPPAVWTVAAALLVLLPGLAVLGLREPVRPRGPGLVSHWRTVGRELRLTCLTPKNAFSLVLLLAPPGAGALIGLLPAIAVDYRVSGNSVVWINGIGGGLLMALGCLLGGWLPARLDRRIAYALTGAVVALPAFFLALAPPTPRTYLAGTVLYLIAIGSTSTVCMSLVLDIVGAVGHGGSLRFSMLMACSYIPISYMSWAEGFAAAHFGGFRTFPMAEAISCLFDLPLVAVWVLSRRRAAPQV
jgi:PAT family beta-lactamase induction signal transducer AmpG